MEEKRESRHPELADPFTRIISKFIDFLLFLFLTQIFQPYGNLAGLFYIFIADGFHNGKSLGKFLTRCSVIDATTHLPCSFKASALRNLPLGITAFFYLIPMIGWFLFLTGGSFLLILETYFVFKDSNRQRVGDTIANTIVVKTSK